MNPATSMMIERLSALAAQGMTYGQAANEIGGTYTYVYHFARRYSVPLSAGRGRGRPAGSGQEAKPNARSEDMRARYQAGETLIEIGAIYGITRERVRQIMTKHYGTRAKDGGQSEQARKSRIAFQKKRDAKMIRRWGCTYKQYQSVLKHPDYPTRAFNQQRSNAQLRNIGWELNLWQWWLIWEKSGHWAERGRGHAYCMCRLNDTGPYSVDNVYIATNLENVQDYWVNRRAAEALEAA